MSKPYPDMDFPSVLYPRMPQTGRLRKLMGVGSGVASFDDGSIELSFASSPEIFPGTPAHYAQWWQVRYARLSQERAEIIARNPHLGRHSDGCYFNDSGQYPENWDEFLAQARQLTMDEIIDAVGG